MEINIKIHDCIHALNAPYIYALVIGEYVYVNYALVLGITISIISSVLDQGALLMLALFIFMHFRRTFFLIMPYAHIEN